jgi:hypothetical protein
MRQGLDPRSANAIKEVNAMSIVIRAHFDGKVLVPDEPLDLPVDEPLELELRAIGHERAVRLREMIARFAARPLPGPALPAEALRRENMYMRTV